VLQIIFNYTSDFIHTKLVMHTSGGSFFNYRLTANQEQNSVNEYVFFNQKQNIWTNVA